jgi:hypothetical protein
LKEGNTREMMKSRRMTEMKREMGTEGHDMCSAGHILSCYNKEGRYEVS